MGETRWKGEPSLLYDRSKLVIMTSLAGTKWNASFLELLETTQLTKGNLSSHLRKLEGEGLIKISKEFLERKPLTTIQVTNQGKQALRNHLLSLQELIKQVKV